tara:strand:- start:50 stop:295 length:246 start_codon:yes stop_codon:yes gene_type:complete
MTEAYVLINCSLGKEEEVIEDVSDIDGISSVHGVFGAYDIIARISVNDVSLMRELITEKIRKIKAIRSTLVLIAIEGQGLE